MAVQRCYYVHDDLHNSAYMSGICRLQKHTHTLLFVEQDNKDWNLMRWLVSLAQGFAMYAVLSFTPLHSCRQWCRNNCLGRAA